MLGTNDQAKIARVTEAFLKMKEFDLAKLRERRKGAPRNAVPSVIWYPG